MQVQVQTPTHASPNPFYDDLVDVMGSRAFRAFCSKYMRTWSDIETVLLYVKLYESIESFLPQASPDDVVAVIDKIMNDAPARRQTVRRWWSTWWCPPRGLRRWPHWLGPAGSLWCSTHGSAEPCWP